MASMTNRVSFGRQRRCMRLHFLHQFLVHVQAAGGVHDEHVVEPCLGFGEGRRGDGHGDHRCSEGKYVDTHLGREALQLFAGRGAVDVGADQQHFLLHAVFEMARELGGAGGLAGALQARQQDDHRRLALRSRGAPGPMAFSSSSWTILMKAWPGREAGADFGAERPLPGGHR